jgi:hypothetical protein
MDKKIEILDEPVILPMWAHQQLDPPPPPDNHEPDWPKNENDFRSETFWAGRNHAMRRSARWAA